MKKEQIDWDSTLELLSTIPQKHHAAYLARLTEATKLRSESLKKRAKKKAATPPAKPKQSKRHPVKYNDVRLTEKEWYAFICARSLIQARDMMVEQVGGGVNGFDFLSSKTMLLHMGEAPTEPACQSLGRNLRSLKSKGLLNWELERVPKGVRNLKVNFRLGLNA